LSPKSFELIGPDVYAIDLDTCTDSAEVLDWIVQIAHKRWATDHVLAQLIVAFDALLDLQGTICPSGINQCVNPRKIVTLEAKIV